MINYSSYWIKFHIKLYFSTINDLIISKIEPFFYNSYLFISIVRLSKGK